MPLRRIEEARESGARELGLSYLELSTFPESIGQLFQLQRRRGERLTTRLMRSQK